MAVITFRRDEDLRSANCLAGDAVENAVYITGDKIGGLLQVSKVDIDDGAKMPAVGLIVSKSDPTTCKIRVGGKLQLSASSLASGNLVFVSATGTPETLPPVRPSSGTRLIQHLGKALAADLLEISPSNVLHEIQP